MKTKYGTKETDPATNLPKDTVSETFVNLKKG